MDEKEIRDEDFETEKQDLLQWNPNFVCLCSKTNLESVNMRFH